MSIDQAGQSADLLGRKSEIERDIVERARRWYRYGNEAELAESVVEYEEVVRKIATQPSASVDADA